MPLRTALQTCPLVCVGQAPDGVLTATTERRRMPTPKLRRRTRTVGGAKITTSNAMKLLAASRPCCGAATFAGGVGVEGCLLGGAAEVEGLEGVEGAEGGVQRGNASPAKRGRSVAC
jgi:hypothetical protein